MVTEDGIRLAAEGDFAAIYDLVCDMEGTHLPLDVFERIFLHQLNDPDHRFLVAEEDGAVMGVLHLRMEEQLHHAARVAEIMELAVAQGSRSQGVGARLFAHACEVAREEGCVQIEVACNQLRERAHHFYERQGMHNFHYKFSLPFTGEDSTENALGR